MKCFYCGNNFENGVTFDMNGGYGTPAIFDCCNECKKNPEFPWHIWRIINTHSSNQKVRK